MNMRGGSIKKIHDTHAWMDPLMYPLLFPTGDYGWHLNMPFWGGRRDNVPQANGHIAGDENEAAGETTGPERTARHITTLQFYAHRFQIRDLDFSPLHHSGRLFQQYIVDMAAKVEQNRLNWFRKNQKTIRSEVYSGLADALDGADGDASRVGVTYHIPFFMKLPPFYNF